MKVLTSLGWSGCALALMALAVKQRQQLAAHSVAHREIGLAISQHSTTASLPKQDVQALNPAKPLTEEEHLELLQLRGQIRPLTDRLAALSVLSNRNVRLHARLAAAQAASTFPGPGYIRRAEAKNRGNQTPEAALETFLWATENRDTNAILTVLGGAIRQSMLAEFNQRGVETYFQSQVRVPGARIVRRRDITDTEAELTIEFGPGAMGPMRFRRENSGWVMEE